MDVRKVNWNEIPWQFVRRGVERKAFSNAGATLALHRLMPGNEQRPHEHFNEQIAYILEGVIDLHVGEEVHRLGPGELIAVPPNVRHYAVVVGDDPVLNLDVFTPNRPEYA